LRHVGPAPPPPSRNRIIMTRVGKLVAERCVAEIRHYGEDDDEHLRGICAELGNVENLAELCCVGINLAIEFPEPFSMNFPWRLARRYGYDWHLNTDGIMHPRDCRVWARPGEKTCVVCDTFSRSDPLLAAIERAHDDELHMSVFTPDCFLSDDQLSKRSIWRAQKMNNLKLALLGRDRRVLRLLKVQSDSKRILVLASTKQIPRMHQLFAQMIKRGASPAVICLKIEKALRGEYNPKGYNLEDLEDSYLALKMGGRRLLYAQNKSRGLASISGTTRNDLFKVPRVVIESGSTLCRLGCHLYIEAYIYRSMVYIYMCVCVYMYIYSGPSGVAAVWRRGTQEPT
jgi:hypothetical protein